MPRSREEMLAELEQLEAERDAGIERRKKREAETAEAVSRFEQHVHDVKEAKQRASAEIADATKEMVEDLEKIDKE